MSKSICDFFASVFFVVLVGIVLTLFMKPDVMEDFEKEQLKEQLKEFKELKTLLNELCGSFNTNTQ